MKHRYQIKGISCGGCIERVKKALEAHQDVEEVKIYLKPLGVTKISMKERISIEALQQQLDQLEGYKIEETT